MIMIGLIRKFDFLFNSRDQEELIEHKNKRIMVLEGLLKRSGALKQVLE